MNRRISKTVFINSVHIRLSSENVYFLSTKMEILKLCRRSLQFFGMCPLGDGSGFWIKIGQIFSASFFLFNFFSVELFSALFCWEHYQIGDLHQHLFAFIQFIGALPTIFSFISLIFWQNRVRDYFDKIQHISDECKCGMNFSSFLRFAMIVAHFPDELSPFARIYARANKMCELFLKWALTFVIASFLASTFALVIIGALFYYVRDGSIDTKNLYLPLKLKCVHSFAINSHN